MSPIVRLGYVGRLSAGKCVDHLLMALGIVATRLQGQSFPFTLDIAGSFVDSAYKQSLTTLIARLTTHQGVPASAITLLGHQASLTPWWPQWDVLVLPSVNEPFGRVLIEAMSHGVLCMGANSGGIPEIIGALGPNDSAVGWLFQPNNPEDLADCLSLYGKQSQADRATMLRNATRRVQTQFSVAQHVKQISDLYADCLDPR
jgi:glycosyltransferase involved in cell wall biosynthesis